MSTVQAHPPGDGHALARTSHKHERLRAQSREWEAGGCWTGSGLAGDASCLDVGCGPGETMRLMAQRVGPAGRVTGIDFDAPLGAQALTMLDNAGHHQCRFLPYDLTSDFSAAGWDLQIGARLTELFTQPEIGTPDGTDVSGRLDARADAQQMLIGAYRSILPTAIAHGITTEQRAAATLSEIARDVERFPSRPARWPLLIAAWKHKTDFASNERAR